jgi:hypothetical protein
MGQVLSITKGTIVDTPDGRRGAVDNYFGAVGGLRAVVRFSGGTQEYIYKDLVPVPKEDLPVVGDTVRLKGEDKILGKVYRVIDDDFWRYRVTKPSGSTFLYSVGLERVQSNPTADAKSEVLEGVRKLIKDKELALSTLHAEIASLRMVEGMLRG